MSKRVNRIALIAMVGGVALLSGGSASLAVQKAQAAKAANRFCPPPKVVVRGKCDCPQDRCFTSGPCGPSYWMNKRKRPC